MKICYKCKKQKNLNKFYRHPGMKDGHLNKCIECAKKDAKIGNVKRRCWHCKRTFFTSRGELNKGGGITCSRKCYFARFKKIVKRDSESPNWKGDNVGKGALHDWVVRHLGKPQKCAKCGTTKSKQYDWANISRKYKRDLRDWIRLCKKCHIRFDGSKSQKNFKKLTFREFMFKL